MADFGINPISIIIYMILLTVLYIVIDKFILSKLVKNLDKRREQIERNNVMAKELEEKMNRLQEQVRETMDQVKAESDKVIERSRKEGLGEKDTIIVKANTEAKSIIDAAVKRLDQERDSMKQTMKSEVEKAVKVAVEKLWEERVSTVDKKIIDKAIDSI